MSIDVPRELEGHVITKAVGEELRRTREMRGFSRAQSVARLPSGIGERTLLAYENGLRQLSLLRTAELSWVLEVDAPTVFARGLQRAHIMVESMPLAVDLYASLGDVRTKFRPLGPWIRNVLDDHPSGVAELAPAVVRNLAAFIGCPHRDLADHLARYVPEDCDDQEDARRP